jgi:chromosome condensin MukBEF ATPase and DNA-binding subunit MukB
MVRRPSPAVIRSKELDDFLKDHNYKFQRWIQDMEAVIKENMLAGELVSKKQIPPH